MDHTNWVTSLASVVAAAGVVFLWIQTSLLRKQLAADHERSRRDVTVRLLQHWNRSISPLTAAARVVVSRLDEEQCRALLHIQPLSTPASERPMLETCLAEILPADPLQAHGDRIQLTTKQVARLRFLATDYLNETEAVLLAWMFAIGNNAMIEHEFSFLCDDRTGNDALEKFRKAAGGDEVYPAIGRFIHTLRQRRLAERPAIKAPVDAVLSTGKN